MAANEENEDGKNASADALTKAKRIQSFKKNKAHQMKAQIADLKRQSKGLKSTQKTEKKKRKMRKEN